MHEGNNHISNHRISRLEVYIVHDSKRIKKMTFHNDYSYPFEKLDIISDNKSSVLFLNLLPDSSSILGVTGEIFPDLERTLRKFQLHNMEKENMILKPVNKK